MKKIVIILVATIAFSVSGLSYDVYHRVTDEDRAGYGKVGHSSQTNESGGTTTKIGCATPGSIACPTVFNDGTPNEIPANAQSICFNHAQNEIGNGVNSGSASINISGVLYYVSWQYDTQTTGQTVECKRL